MQGGQLGLKVGNVHAVFVPLLFVGVEQIAVLRNPSIELLLVARRLQNLLQLCQDAVVLGYLFDGLLPKFAEGLLCD